MERPHFRRNCKSDHQQTWYLQSSVSNCSLLDGFEKCEKVRAGGHSPTAGVISFPGASESAMNLAAVNRAGNETGREGDSDGKATVCS
ncbi:hypothetical protein TNCV_438551 [Trichonephila clavipes]|nr:hypothetical protein TNCV_438551 [Trichonephila clavipes]